MLGEMGGAAVETTASSPLLTNAVARTVEGPVCLSLPAAAQQFLVLHMHYTLESKNAWAMRWHHRQQGKLCCKVVCLLRAIARAERERTRKAAE